MPTVPATPDTSSTDRMRVLVVDDDPDIVRLLTQYLGGHGFDVVSAATGTALRAAVGVERPHLILLDLGLPDEDGLSLLRHLQVHWQTPVIVITGRGDAIERIVGLELGADDYVTKPFDFRELLARMRTVLRRANAKPAESPADGLRLEFEGFRLDPAARILTDQDGREVQLTTGEFGLLRLFLDRPRQVLSRDQLMNSIHGRDSGPFDRAIDVQISRLRHKIETNPLSPKLIKSVRGTGYLFAAEVRKSQG